tara:strand:+ start:1051 stop:1311 length:261 start_codon:yes stop_codon:yes gene_type:complete
MSKHVFQKVKGKFKIMREQFLTALRAYYVGHIAKHKVNVENLITKNMGIAEHPDYIQTIAKEMQSLANYDEQLQMIYKHFNKEDLE